MNESRKLSILSPLKLLQSREFMCLIFKQFIKATICYNIYTEGLFQPK